MNEKYMKEIRRGIDQMSLIVESPRKPENRTGMMPAFTWKNGTLNPGLAVTVSPKGSAIELGEWGRGRKLVEIPTVGLETIIQESEDDDMLRLLDSTHSGPLIVLEAATTLGDEKEGALRLTASQQQEAGAFMVRVSTQRHYTRGTNGLCRPHRGNPTLITEGKGAHGDAGRVCNWTDSLYVVHEGDVLYVQCEGDGSNRRFVLFAKDGELQTEPWKPWKLKDAYENPDFYLDQGLAPTELVPDTWIGQKVTARAHKTWGDEVDQGILTSKNPIRLISESGEIIQPWRVDWIELIK
jgi:hypothetical protein